MHGVKSVSTIIDGGVDLGRLRQVAQGTLGRAAPRMCEGCRRALDIVVSAVALVVFAPLILLIAFLIKLDSPGPVLFRHTRIGRDRRGRRDGEPDARRRQDLGGQPFGFYKFRTMYADARERFPELYTYCYEGDDLSTLPMKVLMGRKGSPEDPDFYEDPRVTRMGRWLRKTSLDELPNFINVLRGEMHLVGPRPDIAENIRYYEEPHMRKLSVRPGVTGLAQIRGRGLLSFRETVAYDVEYVEKRSLLLDFKILVLTIPSMLRGDGAY